MLSRCPRCGDVFAKDRHEICPTCRTRDNERIDLILRYADTNPDASLDDLEKISGMPQDVILGYVREGRLISVESRVLRLKCEECGVEIQNGRFCAPCRRELTSKLAAGASRTKSPRRKN